MNDYTPPVNALLKLGRPEGLNRETDYTPHGVGPADVPELIRLLQDEELADGDSDTPEVYAQIHAWRALGQLRAREAIEPLLMLLDEQEGDDNWNDWLTEEAPGVLGQIGPSVIPAVVARLEQRGQREYAPCYYANALVAVAQRFPETRAEVVSQLSRVLETASVNNSGLNGFIIGDLVDLKAVEAWPVIERAFATDNVDGDINGDAAEVKYLLSLGPKPSHGRGGFRPATTGANAKQRFNERQRKKKAQKKNKKKRK